MDDLFKESSKEASGTINGILKFLKIQSPRFKKFFTTFNLSIIGFILLFFVTVLLYVYPNFLKDVEGFSTIAVDPVYSPKCFARDAEAQRLLAEVVNAIPTTPEGIQWVDEFRLILTKLLCIDADITGSGSGVYSTMDLKFNTFHDMEPVANFVGRCLNRSLKSEISN